MRKGRARILLMAICFMMSGCVRYQLVESNDKVTVGAGFRVNPEIAWSMEQNNTVYLWTVDGPSLEQLIFFPGVKDGAPLFTPANSSTAKELPVYQTSMTLVEVADLLEATLSRQGFHQMEKRNLRPTPFGGQEGFRFDFTFVSKDGLEYRGMAAGTVKSDQLYLVMYMGTQLHYFDKYAPVAERILASIEVL